MDTIACSTRSGLGAGSIDAHAGRLLDLGFDRLTLHRDLTARSWGRLEGYLRPRAVAAAWLFTPVRPARRAGSELPRLGSLDLDERREAVKLGLETVEFLDRNDIPLLIVPSVELEEPGPEAFRALLERSPPRAAVDRFLRERSRAASTLRRFDAFLAVLERILAHAERYGRRVGLVPGGLPHELPDADELTQCLDEFAGAPIGVVADMVRIQRAAFARGVRVEAAALPAQLSGVLVHDGGAATEGLPLGAGSVEIEPWRAVASGPNAGGDRCWIVDLAEAASEEDVLATRGRIEELLGPARSTKTTEGLLHPFLDTSSNDNV